MDALCEDLAQFIRQSDIKDNVETKFVDIFDVDMSSYGNIKQVMDRGFQVPIVAINGKAVFAGGVENEAVYAAVKKILK